MKKTLFLLLTCLLTGMVLNAQDLKLDEILAKFNTAVGQDKLSKVNSIKMVGKMTMMGMEIPMTNFQKRPSKMRSVMEFQGTKIISTFNGKEAYMINPMMGSNEAQKIGDDQLDEYKSRSNIDGPFSNYKENGNQLELAGIEDINGQKAYKIKLVQKSTIEGQAGKTIYHFIDCVTFNLVKSTMTMNIQGAETEAEMYYSNYKQVDGVSMSYTMEIKTGGNTMMTMSYDEIKVNEEMPDELFEKPTN